MFTGHGRDGGFATHVVANATFCLPLPLPQDAVHLAPMPCAGVIGWRSLRMAGDGAVNLGLYGFGAAAHLIVQVARTRVDGCTHSPDPAIWRPRSFARSLGAAWAGGSDDQPPEPLDAAIIFAPVGALVPLALRALRKGGRVVCGGIHMNDIPSFAYRLLWEERQVLSVANLTRADAAEFLRFPARVPMRVETTTYPLERANDALADLRAGLLQGAGVLVP